MTVHDVALYLKVDEKTVAPIAGTRVEAQDPRRGDPV